MQLRVIPIRWTIGFYLETVKIIIKLKDDHGRWLWIVHVFFIYIRYSSFLDNFKFMTRDVIIILYYMISRYFRFQPSIFRNANLSS